VPGIRVLQAQTIDVTRNRNSAPEWAALGVPPR
jgi:hypothetical protein